MQTVKIALVTDHLKEYGGAERWVEAMLELWPGAPIYTSYVRFDQLPPSFRTFDIRPSFLQRLLPIFPEKLLVPLMPIAFARFCFDAYDVVLSSHAFFASNIITHPGTAHISYCHTPPRFLWGYPTDRAWQDSGWFRLLTTPLVSILRMNDYLAAQRVDQFVTNSENVARRIQKFYRREAKVVHCGYDITDSVILATRPPRKRERCGQVKGRPGSSESDSGQAGMTLQKHFYLLVSRLVRYKNVHLAIAACSRLRKNLVIVGDGPARQSLMLQARAGKPEQRIHFLGRVNDEMLRLLYRKCVAVLFPADDDFGNVPVEAMLAGKPVLALRRGGARETVVEGKTGAFFDEPSAESLTAALERFDATRYDPAVCRKQAKKFSKKRFLAKMRKIVEEE